MTSREKEQRCKNWERHIRQWEKSGLNQIDYCREHKISDKCFYYWKKRFHSEAKSVSFVQLPVSEYLSDMKKNNSLNVLLRNDIKIEISENFNPDTLKKVVEALRSIS